MVRKDREGGCRRGRGIDVEGVGLGLVVAVILMVDLMVDRMVG